MRKTCAKVVALVALALWGAATAAVREDVDRFDARRDRQERATGSTLPRTAAGAIDMPKLIVELRVALTRGARDIRFRDATLSASEAKRLRELAERFGFERVRIREQGHRGVRVEFRDVDNMDRERADARKDARDDAITRVELHQRAPRPERVEKAERAERADHSERQGRAERGDRSDRSGRH